MTRKKLFLTATAAAVLAAFNPAFAGGGAKHGSAEDMTSPTISSEQSASPSGNDLNVWAGVSGDRNSGDTERNADAKSSTETVPSISSNAGASSEAPQDQNRSTEPDKLTGLDRAHPAN